MTRGKLQKYMQPTKNIYSFSRVVNVWDPSTGNSLHQYKGGVTAKNTLTWVEQVIIV